MNKFKPSQRTEVTSANSPLASSAHSLPVQNDLFGFDQPSKSSGTRRPGSRIQPSHQPVGQESGRSEGGNPKINSIQKRAQTGRLENVASFDRAPADREPAWETADMREALQPTSAPTSMTAIDRDMRIAMQLAATLGGRGKYRKTYNAMSVGQRRQAGNAICEHLIASLKAQSQDQDCSTKH